MNSKYDIIINQLTELSSKYAQIMWVVSGMKEIPELKAGDTLLLEKDQKIDFVTIWTNEEARDFYLHLRDLLYSEMKKDLLNEKNP